MTDVTRRTGVDKSNEKQESETDKQTGRHKRADGPKWEIDMDVQNLSLTFCSIIVLCKCWLLKKPSQSVSVLSRQQKLHNCAVNEAVWKRFWNKLFHILIEDQAGFRLGGSMVSYNMNDYKSFTVFKINS